MPTKETDTTSRRKVKDDEPIFVLRGQDQTAPNVVRYWADQAEARGVPQAKVDAARRCAEAMERWPKRKMPD